MPANIVILEKYIKDTWNDIPSEYFKLMPLRIKMAIAANGNRIKY